MSLWLGSALACSSVLASAQEATFAVQAKKVLTGTGEAIDSAVVLVENGKIRAVGAGLAIPAGWTVHQHDGVVMPGMIDLGATLGGSELLENHESLTPDLRVAEGLDLWDPSFAAWLGAGVTSVYVIPPTGSVIPGSGAVVKTAGAAAQRIVAAEAGLEIGLNAGARRRDRAPTSVQGTALALRDLFGSPEAQASVQRAKRGELAVFAHADGVGEVRLAAQLAKELGWKARLVGPALPDQALAIARGAAIPLVLRPLDYGAEERTRRSYGALGATPHPLGFASLAQGGAEPGLRRGAALAVRAGLDPAIALRALTGGAAAMLGLEARLGTIAPGRDADLVWLDGDPLDLGTRIVAVFVDGKRADRGAEGH
ncbi:MAG: amidohydrolase family protein [Planctomycetes bacterium]|nr:amidohydrolase family protein [Planctomycetota bacterium]